MKQLYYLIIVTFLVASCAPSPQGVENSPNSATTADQDVFPAKAKDMTIYEVNIRQATPEGTFAAFQEHLPRLRDLGVEILWLMPIQPIGEKNRKGTLGSYYSISDYSAVNPEFGTKEDLKELISEAQAMDFVVILDWVPNHTAWDHPWIKEHPEYYMTDSSAKEVAKITNVGTDYYKTSENNIVYEADWSDIALLNHFNPATRKAMIEEMRYWVEEMNIDGFRADHAGHEIPMYFWEESIEELNKLRPLFWLAEWDEPRMHLTFHATYDWGLLHLTEAVAKGNKTAEDLHEHIRKDLASFGKDAFRLTMITNHDENAWAGTVFERYGEGHKTFATFIFTAYGIPMIYSGQEAGMDKRLEFFEKDTINWDDPKNLTSFYTQLNTLREDNSALWSGEYGAMPEQLLDNNKEVFSFIRENENNAVIGILNLSGKSQSVKFSDAGIAGTYNDYFTNQSYSIGSNDLELQPWQYLIFTK
ncbi:MAG: alpha-amylase family glycosyl hydrolase [Candidatus Cyclobacteriaceae bacterium M2_1C_046]